MFKRFIHAAQFCAVLLVVIPLALLPKSVSTAAGGLLGRGFYIVFKRRRNIALSNTKLVYGRNRPDLVRACFRSLGLSLAETARIWIGRKDVYGNISISGMHHYFQAKAAGHPVILVTGHTGNWELLNNAVARVGCRFGIVVRPLDNPWLNRMSETIRERYGNVTIPKWGALKGMLKVLKSGGTVAVLMDQGVVPAEGVITEFLGHPAYTAKMPAILAQKTGATVIAVFMHRSGNGHHVEFHKPLPVVYTDDRACDIEQNMQTFTRSIEDYVRRHPEEWLWIHRRWKRAAEGIEEA